MDIDAKNADILWQRGISLYYLNRFDDAVEQFARDVRLNPRDSEEAIWALVSQARKGGNFEDLQKDIIKIEGELRPYIKTAYDVFAGTKPVSECKFFLFPCLLLVLNLWRSVIRVSPRAPSCAVLVGHQARTSAKCGANISPDDEASL